MSEHCVYNIHTHTILEYIYAGLSLVRGNKIKSVISLHCSDIFVYIFAYSMEKHELDNVKLKEEKKDCFFFKVQCTIVQCEES